MTLTVNIVATGKTLADVGDALDEAKNRIVNGEFTSGSDSNESSSFIFDVEGEETS